MISLSSKTLISQFKPKVLKCCTRCVFEIVYDSYMQDAIVYEPDVKRRLSSSSLFLTGRAFDCDPNW